MIASKYRREKPCATPFCTVTFMFSNGQDNRRTVRASGLIVGLGRLGEVPDTRPTERTARKEYHFRLPERDVTARSNIERKQRKKMKAA